MRVSSPLPLLLSAAFLAASGDTRTYMIDPAASRVVVHVGRSGLFSFAGHTHEVTAAVAGGEIVLDSGDPTQSSVRVEFDASTLKVTGRGEPADDVPEVQRTMESSRVLDVARFPRISYTSRTIRVIGGSPDRVRLRVTGDLTLHGVTRSTTSEVSADIASDQVRATGSLVVKQTDFGIDPVTAGGGTVRVKDSVDVEFTLVGRSQ